MRSATVVSDRSKRPVRSATGSGRSMLAQVHEGSTYAKQGVESRSLPSLFAPDHGQAGVIHQGDSQPMHCQDAPQEDGENILVAAVDKIEKMARVYEPAPGVSNRVCTGEERYGHIDHKGVSEQSHVR